MKLTILVFFISITISAQVIIPPDFPFCQITVNTNDSSGQLFFSTFWRNNGSFSPPYLAIMNNDGTFTFIRQLPQRAFDFKMQPNGNYTYYDSNDSVFYEMNKQYNIIDTFYTKNGYITDVHDLQLLPNGDALMLAQDYKPVNMSLVVPGGNPNAVVIDCVIQELDSNKNVIFQWKGLDHYKITDAMPDISLLDSTIDYIHANSIDVDTDGNFLLSARYLDEVTKINRITGDIIWRFGGKNNQYLFTNDSIGFSHQHDVRRIANGDITIFDNGNTHVPQFSRAVEYKLDEINKIATLVWEFINDTVIYTPAMGSVQRLDNGNTLIGWGENNTNYTQITEVNNAGQKVFELEYPYNSSYRAFRFNVLSTSINNNPIIVDNYNLSQNYPNPFNPATVIDYSVPVESNVKLTVYNAIGEKIRDLFSGIKPQGNYSINFYARNLSSGVYFYSLKANSLDGKQNYYTVKKMIVLK